MTAAWPLDQHAAPLAPAALSPRRRPRRLRRRVRVASTPNPPGMARNRPSVRVLTPHVTAVRRIPSAGRAVGEGSGHRDPKCDRGDYERRPACLPPLMHGDSCPGGRHGSPRRANMRPPTGGWAAFPARPRRQRSRTARRPAGDEGRSNASECCSADTRGVWSAPDSLSLGWLTGTVVVPPGRLLVSSLNTVDSLSRVHKKRATSAQARHRSFPRNRPWKSTHQCDRAQSRPGNPTDHPLAEVEAKLDPHLSRWLWFVRWLPGSRSHMSSCWRRPAEGGATAR